MLLIIILLLLDQISKHLLTTTINKGAAFGLFQGYTTLLIIVSLIVLIICIYYYKDKNLRLGLSFLIAGIIGNLMDRIFLGYVRDFIEISIFPVFNLADSFNVIGAILLIYLSFRKK
ncbi:MAG: signal peptidase II [Nanoarchaeota archaeon]